MPLKNDDFRGFWNEILIVVAVMAIIAFSLSAAPAQDTCFSPAEICDVKLATLLRSAKPTIDIAIYDIDDAEIVAAILAANRQGVKLRLVVDRVQAGQKNSAVPMLAKTIKLPMKYGKQSGSGIMHNKFDIVDGKSLETGSYNYTEHATHFNHENQFYTDDAGIISRYRTYFEELWQSGGQIK